MDTPAGSARLKLSGHALLPNDTQLANSPSTLAACNVVSGNLSLTVRVHPRKTLG